MEEFLPSEIARAVYGYLLSVGCKEAARIFLDTSPNLTECKQRVNTGKPLTHANTLLLGRNLTEVLNIACSFHSIVKQAQEKRQQNKDDIVGETSFGLLEQLRSFVLREGNENLSLQESNVQEQQPNCDQAHQVSEVNNGKEATPKKIEHLQTNTEQTFSPPLTLDSLVLQDDRSQPCSQSDVLHSEPSPQHLNTPKRSNLQKGEASLAENYKNLVQECSAGLDLSSSPDKSHTKNRNGGCRTPINQPISAPLVPELEVENQSAIAAIAGITFRSSQSSQVLVTNPSQMAPICTSLPTSTNMNLLSDPIVTPASTGGPQTYSLTSTNTQQVYSAQSVAISTNCNLVSSVTPSFSAPQPIMSTASTSFLYPNTQPMVLTNSDVDGIDKLPDPPIIMLNSQYQPVDANTSSASYFGGPPCAASTPRSTMFAPEDTACIIYPLISTTLPRKKKKVKEKPQGVTSLRKLLPKPPRKDPPNIIHVKVLPQNIDEEDEDEEANDSNNGLENDNNEMELAKELPELGEGGEHSEIEKENTVKEDILQPRSKDDNSITIDEKMSRENNTDKEKSTVEKGNDKETQVNTPKPKALKKNISRSTPRRNSHIRALSFNTPLKPTVNRKSNTSPKMPKIRFSPRTNKLNNIKRSSLFKSPTSPKSLKDLSRLTEDDENESHEDEKETKNNENLIGKSSKTQTCGRNLTSTQKTPKQSYLHLENEEAEKENSGDFFEKSSLTKIPIATRSPAPKLSNAWKEVNDITITEKPQWDEKIRSFISGDFVDPAPPPKMKTKRKTKEKTSSHEKISKEVSVQENKGERRSLRLTKKNEKSSKKYSTKTNCSSVVKDTPKKVILASSLQSIKKSNHSRKRALKKPHGESQQSVSSREISSSSDGSFTTLNQTGSSLNRYDNKNVDIDSSKPKNDILGKCSDVNEKEPTTEDNVLTTTNNILLEDLVVSSNSCFPQIGDDVGNERNKLSKEISRRLNENSMEKQPPVSDNHTILESDETPSLKTCSPEFALPHVPTLETPLKEFQIITPQTCLNTPMLNIIRQDVSVLEEDLLLTPSLPPTPQVNFFKQPVKTPCKSKMSPNNNHKYNEDKTRYVEQSLHYVSDIKSAKSPTTINENKTQSSCKQIHGINSESINNEPQTTHEKNSKADAIISKKLKQENIITIQKPKNDVISTSTDSSEDDIVNNYVAKLQNNKSNVTVQTKLANKSKINTPPSKTNIYTSSESSNDGIDYTVKNNQTKTNMSKLSSMILQNERKKLDCKTKIPACNKKQKKMLKKCSQSTASLSSNFVELSSSKKIEKSIRKKSKSIDKNSISEEEKEQNSAKQSKKNNSPKISSSVNKFETSLTPEKVRQQLQLDLLKRERQMIFGDGVSFSSDSDTETEVFERKTFVAKKTKSNKSEKLKRKSSQEVNSDISSTIFPTKDQEKEKFEKCAKFENSKQNKATKDSIELKKDDSTVEEITVMIKASSEKTQHELVEDSNKEVLRAVESIALISPCQSSQSTVIKYTERTTYTELSNSSSYINENNSECIENFKVQEHLARSVGSKNIISSVIKDKSLEDNYNTNEEDVNLSNSHVKNNGVHESEITRESEEKDTISEKDLPRPPTPYRINPDNVRNVPNPINQSQFSESSEVEENHIFVVSSTTCTKINTSFCTSEFDPNMKCGFEVDDNKVITASFSEMILHLALPSKTCNHIKKTSQEKIPSGGEISKYPAGKRRVKLTPVCDDKYEQKLKVDYDIDEEGHIINKKGEKRIVSDLDVLDVSCSTIETNISLAENNASIPSSFELITSKQLVKDSKVRENEQKCNLTKNITDRPETSRNENKNCSFSDLKKCEVDNNTTESKYEQYISRERNQHYTCRYDSKMTSSSESAGRPKEGSRRKEADQISLNESVSSEDKRNKYIHRTHSDRRKERESSHRRMDSSHRRRSSEEIKQNKKYFERRRCRDYDRRVYSERRYYTSTRRQRREESSSPESRRRGFKQHTSETSLARCHSSRTLRSNTDKNALFVKKLNVHYEDVDNVEKVGNRSGKDESILNPTVKVDPRSAQIITYSDLEKNESSSDGAPSLMDFAVMHKTKDNRSATISPHSSQQLDVDNDKVDSSLSHKRKALDDGETGLDTPQTHKKLKLGEVEMKEAKSVLKHKMADMLNVLHPDTSNEAS